MSHYLRLLKQSNSYKFWHVFLFVIFLLLNLIILPAHSLGTDIGLQSFLNLDVTVLLFSIMFATTESMLIILWAILLNQNSMTKKNCSIKSAGSGMVIGFISPLLCCTPVLPTLLSLIAVVIPNFDSKLGVSIQYFTNVYQIPILITALLLMVFSIIQNMKYLKRNA